ncbi:MAG TPA: heavy metal-binding domain-containing protein [Pyrinomonadaceae bacterium]|nr:heavy metal-binding domain-containing protein [Pyrinomonadaceae bacterium]
MNRREFVVAGSFTLATLALNAKAQEKKQYVCPPCGCRRDGEVHNEPGNCPACDMALIEKTAAMSELTGIPNFLKLTDQVWTGGQPWPEHLPKLKDAGIKIILNLRPHAEHDGQREELKVKELGMSYFNIPVAFSSPDELDADDFLKITDEQLRNGPVFIHCAIGARVGAFWMIRRVLRDSWEVDKALEEANRIGLRSQSPLVEFAKEYIEKKKKK